MLRAVLAFFVPVLMGQTVAVTDCTSIDTRYGAATAHTTIVITGDRITARGPTASTPVPPGARIVSGSGKFVIPGLWDMHVHVGEIEEDAATWNPAEFLHVSRDLRSVDPGKVADLVVLDANPLTEIAYTRRIQAVVRRGRVLDAAAIRKMLEGVRAPVAK